MCGTEGKVDIPFQPRHHLWIETGVLEQVQKRFVILIDYNDIFRGSSDTRSDSKKAFEGFRKR